MGTTDEVNAYRKFVIKYNNKGRLDAPEPEDRPAFQRKAAKMKKDRKPIKADGQPAPTPGSGGIANMPKAEFNQICKSKKELRKLADKLGVLDSIPEGMRGSKLFLKKAIKASDKFKILERRRLAAPTPGNRLIERFIRESE